MKNSYLPVQKCPPNPGLHRSHLPVDTSHTVSFWLFSHLQTLQKSPKNPGLHTPHLPVVFSHMFPSKLFWHSHSVNIIFFVRIFSKKRRQVIPTQIHLFFCNWHSFLQLLICPSSGTYFFLFKLNILRIRTVFGTKKKTILIETEHEWRHPLLDMPTFPFSSATYILM